MIAIASGHVCLHMVSYMRVKKSGNMSKVRQRVGASLDLYLILFQVSGLVPTTKITETTAESYRDLPH